MPHMDTYITHLTVTQPDAYANLRFADRFRLQTVSHRFVWFGTESSDVFFCCLCLNRIDECVVGLSSESLD